MWRALPYPMIEFSFFMSPPWLSNIWAVHMWIIDPKATTSNHSFSQNVPRAHYARPTSDLKLVCTLIPSETCATTLASASSKSLPLEISVTWLGLPRSLCHALLDSSLLSLHLLRFLELFSDVSETKGEDNVEKTLRSIVLKSRPFLSNGPSVGRQAAIMERQHSV